MRVIINADDLGINQSVNDAILGLIDQGGVTSATLIANGPAVEDAVRRAPRRKRYSFGAHLNLTEFTPLTPTSQWGPLRELLNDRGEFRGEEHLRSVVMAKPLRLAILREWRLQIELLKSLGVSVSHLDSHNHVHTLPALFRVLKRLQLETGIAKVRTTWNVYSPQASPPRLLLAKKLLWDKALRWYRRTAVTEAFTSFSVFYELAVKRELQYETIELMVHPGHPDFASETELLSSNWQCKVFGKPQLISYSEL